jgi:hypothetical protein
MRCRPGTRLPPFRQRRQHAIGCNPPPQVITPGTLLVRLRKGVWRRHDAAVADAGSGRISLPRSADLPKSVLTKKLLGLQVSLSGADHVDSRGAPTARVVTHSSAAQRDTPDGTSTEG